MDRHREVRVKPGAKIVHFRQGLMSVVPTRTVQGLIVDSCCLDPIIRNSVLSLIFSLSLVVTYASFHDAPRLCLIRRTVGHKGQINLRPPSLYLVFCIYFFPSPFQKKCLIAG